MEKDNSRYNLRELAKSINPKSSPEFDLWFLMNGGKRIRNKEEISAEYFKEVNHLNDIMDTIRLNIHPDDFDMILEEKQYLNSLTDFPGGDTNKVMVCRVKPMDDRFNGEDKYGYFRVWRKIVRKRGHEDTINLLCHDITHELELLQITLAPDAIDEATGIKNRTAFEAFCMLQRPNTKMETLLNYVSILKIDDFENLKAKYGEAGTDKIIKRIGDVLRSVQTQSVIARFSEDSFIFILHNSKNEAEAKNKIQTVARRMRTPMEDGFVATVSAGFAQCRHDPERGYACAYDLAELAINKDHEKEAVVAYSED